MSWRHGCRRRASWKSRVPYPRRSRSGWSVARIFLSHRRVCWRRRSLEILVLAGIHAAAEFVARRPERRVEFGFLEHHKSAIPFGPGEFRQVRRVSDSARLNVGDAAEGLILIPGIEWCIYWIQDRKRCHRGKKIARNCGLLSDGRYRTRICDLHDVNDLQIPRLFQHFPVISDSIEHSDSFARLHTPSQTFSAFCGIFYVLDVGKAVNTVLSSIGSKAEG